MIHKKICLLGSFSVGKTSLVKRFVESIFGEKYITSIGVKINKKIFSVSGVDVSLMVWDLEGEDAYTKIKASYLRGSSGYILVADGTRPETLATALDIHKSTQALLGPIPAILAINKADIEDQWLLTPGMLDEIEGLSLLKTSAKSDDNVDQLFYSLSHEILSVETSV